jgi:hypothetical protein
MDGLLCLCSSWRIDVDVISALVAPTASRQMTTLASRSHAFQDAQGRAQALESRPEDR